MNITAIAAEVCAAGARSGWGRSLGGDGAASCASSPCPPPTPQAAPARGAAAAAPQQPLLAPRLYIELDDASDRFVQTMVDTAGETILRRYPNEGQLAFSRGVNAYVHAMRQG